LLPQIAFNSSGQIETVTSPKCAVLKRHIYVLACPIPPPILNGISSFKIALWYESLRKPAGQLAATG